MLRYSGSLLSNSIYLQRDPNHPRHPQGKWDPDLVLMKLVFWWSNEATNYPNKLWTGSRGNPENKWGWTDVIWAASVNSYCQNHLTNPLKMWLVRSPPIWYQHQLPSNLTPPKQACLLTTCKACSHLKGFAFVLLSSNIVPDIPTAGCFKSS